MKKKMIAILLTATMALSLFAGCGSKTEEVAETPAEETEAEQPEKEEEEEITITLWAANQMVTADELKLPESQWYMTNAIERFEEAHPNVNIEMVLYNDNAQLANDFKAAAVAGEGPDVVNFTNGPFLLSVKEALLPLNDYLNDDLLSNFVGWETCAEDMDPSKTIYGVPFGTQSVACFAYNRELISKAGLDFDTNPPRTLEEFYDALDTIKAAGIQPIHLDEGVPRLLLFALNMWWEQKTGTDGLAAHNLELTKYAEDEGLLFMMEEYQKFYENGWINEDAATSADGYNVFLQGESALCTFGLWDMASFAEALGDNYGIMPIPTADEAYVDTKTAVGGVGAALAVANFSENPDMAFEFVNFLSSYDETLAYYKTSPGIPARTDITAEDIGMAEDPVFVQASEMAKNIYFWPDNFMSSDVTNVFRTFASQVLVGQVSPQEFAEMMDEAQLD